MVYAPLSLLAGTIRGRKPCAPTGILFVMEPVQQNELMQAYLHVLVRKARALKVAVERELKPALN